jgi:catechol 2,3-dioxygenase-like lactoylglutathione lyase family enzyme
MATVHPQLKYIQEVTLYAKNLTRSMEFYMDTLGLFLMSYQKERQLVFRIGHGILQIFPANLEVDEKARDSHWGGGHLHVAFACAAGELETWRLRLDEEEVTIVSEQTWDNGKVSILFRDPDGHLIELMEEGTYDFGVPDMDAIHADPELTPPAGLEMEEGA